MMMCRLFLLLSCILLGHHVEGAVRNSPLAAASRALNAKNTLDYGATCSVSDETQRIALNEKLTSTLESLDVTRMNAMAIDIELVNLNTGNFCNSQKNLQCQRNGKCGCANTGVAGIRMSSSREGSNCRLNRGSTCVPREALSALGTQAPDLQCQTGTSCLLKRDRSTCTQAKMTDEIRNSIDTSRGFPDLATFRRKTLEKLREGICECA